jgi:hypothetical protein
VNRTLTVTAHLQRKADLFIHECYFSFQFVPRQSEEPVNNHLALSLVFLVISPGLRLCDLIAFLRLFDDFNLKTVPSEILPPDKHDRRRATDSIALLH